MRDIDEIERRAADEILSSCERAKVFLHARNERVRLWVIEPDAVGHRGVNVDHHDVPPIELILFPRSS